MTELEDAEKRLHALGTVMADLNKQNKLLQESNNSLGEANVHLIETVSRIREYIKLHESNDTNYLYGVKELKEILEKKID